MSITTDNYFIALLQSNIVYHSLLIAHTPIVHSTFTDNCITLITWYRMATMPCTRLHKVGVSMSSSTCCRCLEQGSMRKIRSPIPCCTGQPSVVTARWHFTSLQSYRWTHRTGTRCVECQGTVVVSKCKVYVCAWFSLCSEACCDKTGVTWTRLCSVLCYAFRVLSHSLLTGSCLVMDHQCIVFTSCSQPVIAGCCRIYLAGIFDSIIVQ